MVDQDLARSLALSFPEVYEEDHFGKPSFRVKKKIFSTIWLKENIMMIRLNEVDQSVFCDIDPKMIYPVDGTWGKQGATKFELSLVDEDILLDALTKSYCNIAPKNLVALINNKPM